MSGRDLINIADYEKAAAAKMSRVYFDYYASGSDDELTLSENQAAFRRIQLYHRVLRGLAPRDLSTTILGHDVTMPVFIAPTGMQKLAHPDGELAMVRAAGAAGVIFVLSTASTTPLEEVLAAAAGPVWFQLYMYNDREVTAALVARAQEAGCQAIVLTVDTVVLGRRERDIRNRFSLPSDLQLSNFAGEVQGNVPAPTAGSGLAAYTAAMFKSDLSWDDVAWLREVSRVPVLLKGVSHPDDGRRAVEAGVDGIIVSNHGGRQLDGGPATIDLLPGVAAAVDGRIPVLLDGGVRRGSDILKGLALGALGVGLGRAPLWGLAVDGEAGVSRVLEILKNELETTMALCGVERIGGIDSSLIFS